MWLVSPHQFYFLSSNFQPPSLHKCVSFQLKSPLRTMRNSFHACLDSFQDPESGVLGLAPWSSASGLTSHPPSACAYCPSLQVDSCSDSPREQMLPALCFRAAPGSAPFLNSKDADFILYLPRSGLTGIARSQVCSCQQISLENKSFQFVSKIKTLTLEKKAEIFMFRPQPFGYYFVARHFLLNSCCSPPGGVRALFRIFPRAFQRGKNRVCPTDGGRETPPSLLLNTMQFSKGTQ